MTIEQKKERAMSFWAPWWALARFVSLHKNREPQQLHENIKRQGTPAPASILRVHASSAFKVVSCQLPIGASVPKHLHSPCTVALLHAAHWRTVYSCAALPCIGGIWLRDGAVLWLSREGAGGTHPWEEPGVYVRMCASACVQACLCLCVLLVDVWHLN